MRKLLTLWVVLLITSTGALRRAVPTSPGTRTSPVATRETALRAARCRCGRFGLFNYLVGHIWQRRLICAAGVLCYTSGNVICMLTGDSTIELVNGLGSAFLLVFVIGSVRTQRYLSHPVFTKIGKVSYSAYLIHLLILICLTPHLLKWLGLLTSHHFGLWLGGYLLTVLIVQALSLLSYKWLEIPSVAMGHRITDRIRSFSL